MADLKDKIEYAKDILKTLREDKDVYMRIYPFTTENINGYINYFDFKNKSLLTLGSSGDQILNAYLNGCRDITLLDINPFAKYYINLKIAGVLSFDYQEFQDFFFKQSFYSKRYDIDLFKKLSNNLKAIDYDSYYFFEYIFNNYSMERISDYLMNDDQDNRKVIINFNNYLQDEDSYNKLKKCLKDIYFKVIQEDIFKYDSNLKFDNIFLSNICIINGVGIFTLKDLLIKLNNNNLNKNGSIQLAYLWNIDYNDNELNLDLKEMYRMPAVRHWLEEFITEHYDIKGEFDISHDQDKKSDLVLIYRK